ncbi:MAG: U-box domain protein [Terrestrivirus sp.]|uniref:U-box domain protein n=1 Tax=Terrestrivirus sp. TaxID=2487775 RepID=A0A3G4ZLM4_9VIRU|nr:MAG: U-box domain protein [Terrestrivirus sp.]
MDNFNIKTVFSLDGDYDDIILSDPDLLNAFIIEKIGQFPDFDIQKQVQDIINYFNDCFLCILSLDGSQTELFNILYNQFNRYLTTLKNINSYNTYDSYIILAVNDENSTFIDSYVKYFTEKNMTNCTDDSDAYIWFCCSMYNGINRFCDSDKKQLLLKILEIKSIITTIINHFQCTFIHGNKNDVQITGANDEKNGFFSLLIPSFSLDILDIIMKDESILEKFIDKINSSLHLNISYSYSQLSFIELNSCASPTFINMLMKIMLYIYSKTISKSGSNVIDNCMDNSPRKNTFVLTENDNLDTKIVTTLLFSIKLGYNPLRRLKDYYKKELDILKEDLDYYKTLKSKERSRSYLRAKTLYETTENKYNIISLLYTETEVISEISEFIFKLMNHCTKVGVLYSDDFAFDLVDKFRTDLVNGSFQITEDIITFMINILSNKIISNKHVKFSLCFVIIKYTEDNGYSKINSYGDKIIYDLHSSIMKFVSDVNYFELVTAPTSYVFHESLVSFINYYCEKINQIKNIENIENIDENDRAKIIFLTEGAFHKIISNANDFVSDIIKNCKYVTEELKKSDNNLFNMFNENYRISTIREQLKPLFMESIRACMVSIQSLYIFAKCNMINVTDFTPDLVMPISSFVSSLLTTLSDGKSPLYEIFYLNMETLDLLKELFNLINCCCENKHFKESLKYSINILQEMLPRVKVNEILKQELSTNIEEIKLFNMNEDEEIPHEFLDPLLCTEIINPVMIPDINDIYDKSSILIHLHEEKTNPLTRKPLTIEEFNLYQQNEDVKQKIKEFNERYKLFKNLK